MCEIIKANNLLDLEKTIAKPLFEEHTYAFEVLPRIKDYILKIGRELPLEKYNLIDTNIWVSKDVKVYPTATIEGPTIIGAETVIRPGAYIRGSAIIGKNCVIGNSTEIKNSILFDNVQVPHYNYVGDSILGYKAHMAAGSITANLQLMRKSIILRINGHTIETNLSKFGAIIGDGVEIGCQAVLNPGTIIGRNSVIYPLTSVRGYVEPNVILKLKQNQEVKYGRTQ